MQIAESTVNELIDYLARKPYYEVAKLINKLALASQDKVEITQPGTDKPVKPAKG